MAFHTIRSANAALVMHELGYSGETVSIAMTTVACWIVLGIKWMIRVFIYARIGPVCGISAYLRRDRFRIIYEVFTISEDVFVPWRNLCQWQLAHHEVLPIDELTVLLHPRERVFQVLRFYDSFSVAVLAPCELIAVCPVTRRLVPFSPCTGIIAVLWRNCDLWRIPACVVPCFGFL